jgi:hypothetical protein
MLQAIFPGQNNCGRSNLRDIKLVTKSGADKRAYPHLEMRVIEHRNIDHAQLLQLAKMLLLLVEPQEPSLELEAMTQLKKEVMLVKDFVKAS